MARHLLSARQVQVAREGDTFDGDGLILRVRDGRAAWVLRYTAPTGKRRELGLGPADRNSIEAAGASLTRARKVADEAREELSRGIDPIESRRSDREAQRKTASQAKAQAHAAATTLRGYARIYHEKHVEPLRTVKHAQQWINSIEQHVPAALLDTPIERINAVDLLDELVPILRRVPETGSRIYQRLATILLIDALPRRPVGDQRLLSLEGVDGGRHGLLHVLFRFVVSAEEGVRLLPVEELAEVLGSAHREDLFIGVAFARADASAVLYRGNLEPLVIPLSWFRQRPRGPEADVSELAVTDFGQTVRLGAYEAATDAILYEFDEAFRRRAKKRQLQADHSFGGGLRRLRLQKRTFRTSRGAIFHQFRARTELSGLRRVGGVD